MRVDINGYCTSGPGTVRLMLTPGIGLNLHKSMCEKVITFTFQWLLWRVSLTVQWYRNEYVEALREDYTRVVNKLGDQLDTGMAIYKRTE